ncbi:MAG: leucine-rich repeat protein [Paludibacteraceae bacterium]|nr:leucine-rich repeat protein [Paludibacteraceae bacterium]
MKCPHCGKEIADYSRFCEHCGGRVEQTNPPVQAPKKKRGLKLLWRILGVLVSLIVCFGIVALVIEEMKKWHGMPLYVILCASLLLFSCIVYFSLIRPYCRHKTNIVVATSILALNVIFDVAWFNMAVYTSATPIVPEIFKPYAVKVNIPKSITQINDRDFWYCRGLREINVEDGNYVYSSQDGVLYNKDKTTLIVCPRSKRGSVAIPNSVTEIMDRAFSDCFRLTSVTIPNSVRRIGDYAFGWCTSLTNVIISNSISNIREGVFFSCSAMKSVTIPNSVSSIGSLSFCGCMELTSVTIPNSVTAIGDQAFSDCYSLSSVTIPSSVTYIGNAAFKNCYSLTSVTIPSTVTSIGENAFKDVPQIIYNGPASDAPWGAKDHLFEESFEAVAE